VTFSMFTRGNVLGAVSRLSKVRSADLEIVSGTIDEGFFRVCRSTRGGDDPERGWYVFRNVGRALEIHALDLASELKNYCVTLEDLRSSKYFTAWQLLESLLRHSRLEDLDHWITVRRRFLKLDPVDAVAHLIERLSVKHFEDIEPLSEVPRSAGEESFCQHLYSVVWHQCRHDDLAMARELVSSGGGLVPQYITRGLGYEIHVVDTFFVETKE